MNIWRSIEQGICWRLGSDVSEGKSVNISGEYALFSQLHPANVLSVVGLCIYDKILSSTSNNRAGPSTVETSELFE